MCFQEPCQLWTCPKNVEPLTLWMCFQGALSVVNLFKWCRTTHTLDVFSGALSVVNSLKQCRTTHSLDVFSGGLVSCQLAQTMQNNWLPGCVFRGLVSPNAPEQWSATHRLGAFSSAIVSGTSMAQYLIKYLLQHIHIIHWILYHSYILTVFPWKMTSISILCFYYLGYHIHTIIINMDNSLFEATATTLTS